MKKHLTKLFVAVLCTLSAGVAGTLLTANNVAIETNAATSSTYNYASSLAGWWSEKGGNNGQAVADGKTTINFEEAGGTIYCTANPPEAGKNYKITFIGKSLGDGPVNANFCVFTSWSLIKSLTFSTEESEISFEFTWPSENAPGFCIQRTGGASTSLELSALKFEEVVPHTVSYINSLNYASSIAYWIGDASLTDDGVKVTRAVSNLNIFIGDHNGVFAFEKGKTYTISLEIKTANMYINFAINSPWETIKSSWFNISEFERWDYTFTASDKFDSALIFQLNDGSGDLYVKNLFVGEVISSSTLNENDSFGKLPETPAKAGYKDGKWNIEGEEINSETKFTYGKDVFAYLTYADATKEYASNFLTTLTCDGVDKITASEGYWNNLKAEFNKLDDTSKAALKNAVPNASGNEIEQCIARYDFVVNKYGLEDFMNRGISVFSSLNQLGNNNNNQTLIIVVALASATLIAGASFFIFKKKYR